LDGQVLWGSRIGGGWPAAKVATVVVLAATVAQLLVATLVPDLPQFSGKGFTARLVAYPAMMLAVPLAWWLRQRRSTHAAATPWTAFALVMAPFLVDVTGNTLDLYDTVTWWDDANHLVNWGLLCGGLGLLLVTADVARGAVLGWLVAGLGALLAIGWEVGEWYAFIRHGTELATAYEDTLGDEVLGCLGAAAAGTVLARRDRRAAASRHDGHGGRPASTSAADLHDVPEL
jgi:hypothetical protein